MINVQTVGVLLRVLEASGSSPLAPTPVPLVHPVPAVKPVNTEGTGEQPPYRPGPQREGRVARDPEHPRQGMPIPGVGAGDDDGARVGVQTESRASPRAATTEAPARPSTANNVRQAITRSSATPSAALSAAALPATSVPAAPPGALLRLSSGAQLVQSLLQMPAAAPDVAGARGPAPLLGAPPDTGAALAPALADAVSKSGLFYESHLAAWAVQRYPVADLLQEPQAQWTAAAPSAAPATALPANPAPASAPDPLRPATLPDAAPPLLRQQLETLETRQVVWQGEVWPEQRATLAIAEEDSPAPEAAGSRAWRARLDVVLPTLGAVHADVCLNGNVLRLVLSAAESGSVEQLRTAREPLVAALAAHALDATGVVIRHDPLR